MDIEKLKNNVSEILYEVSDIVRLRMKDNLEISTKKDKNDLVTNIDKLVEHHVNESLKEKYPECEIISEEGFGDKVSNLKGLVFFVDPIDGTLNFVKSKDNFASMIGCYYDGEPILGAIIDVMKKKLYIGGPSIGVFLENQKLSGVTDKKLTDSLITVSTRQLFKSGEKFLPIIKKSSGLRIFGSAGIIFGRILEDKQNAYISYLAPWDLAAGKVLCETLGLCVVCIDGSAVNMLQSQSVIIGTKQLTQEVLEMLK